MRGRNIFLGWKVYGLVILCCMCFKAVSGGWEEKELCQVETSTDNYLFCKLKIMYIEVIKPHNNIYLPLAKVNFTKSCIEDTYYIEFFFEKTQKKEKTIFFWKTEKEKNWTMTSAIRSRNNVRMQLSDVNFKELILAMAEKNTLQYSLDRNNIFELDLTGFKKVFEKYYKKNCVSVGKDKFLLDGRYIQ